jgi:hypothetical protein
VRTGSLQEESIEDLFVEDDPRGWVKEWFPALQGIVKSVDPDMTFKRCLPERKEKGVGKLGIGWGLKMRINDQMDLRDIDLRRQGDREG